MSDSWKLKQFKHRSDFVVHSIFRLFNFRFFSVGFRLFFFVIPSWKWRGLIAQAHTIWIYMKEKRLRMYFVVEKHIERLTEFMNNSLNQRLWLIKWISNEATAFWRWLLMLFQHAFRFCYSHVFFFLSSIFCLHRPSECCCLYSAIVALSSSMRMMKMHSILSLCCSLMGRSILKWPTFMCCYSILRLLNSLRFIF